MKKVKKWLSRYVPAEIAAALGALLGAGIFYLATGNRIVAAYTGAMGENIGFYGFLALRDIKKNKATYAHQGKSFGFKGYIKTVYHLILEFGVAELLDTLFVRPFFLYWFPTFISNYALGIVLGKFAADIIFYIPTIIAYELKKTYLK
jgi:hypothetical protein